MIHCTLQPKNPQPDVFMDVTYLAALSSCSQDFVSDCVKLIQLQYKTVYSWF